MWLLHNTYILFQTLALKYNGLEIWKNEKIWKREGMLLRCESQPVCCEVAWAVSQNCHVFHVIITITVNTVIL